jgi:hypothetical protein
MSGVQLLKIRENRHCYINTTSTDPIVVDHYAIHTYQCLLVITLVTFGMLVYINYRVIKIVRTKDMPLVLMLAASKLSLLSFAIFYGFQASIN